MTVDGARRRRRRARLAVVAGMTSASAVTAWWFVRFVDEGAHPVLYARVAGAYLFAVAAAVVWRRYGRTRLASLLAALAAASLTLHAGILWASRLPWVWALGSVASDLDIALLLWVLHAYPDGRIREAWTRWIVRAVWAVWALKGPVSLLFYDPSVEALAPPGACVGCPASLNPVLLWRWDSYVRTIDTVGLTVTSVLMLVTAVVLLSRWWRASAAGRRVYGPLQVPASLLLVAAAVQGVLWQLQRFGVQPPVAPLEYGAYVGTVAYVLLPGAFVLGLSRDRSRRARVADLVLGLRGAGEGLEAALRQVLGDPTLDVAEVFPDGSVRRADGGAVVLPAPDDRLRMARWLVGDGRRLGVLVHDRALLEHPRVLEAAETVATLVLANSRLAAERQESLAEVRASRARIVAAGDEARRQVERDLHDGAQQRLLTAALVARLLEDRAPSELRGDLGALSSELLAAVEELRQLAQGLYPSTLVEGGLPAAFEVLAARSGLPVEVDVVVPGRLPAPVEACAYFVASEALANAAKHARASRLELIARVEGGVLVVDVRDDGVGGADLGGAGRGSGLRGLRDRVEALDGEMVVSSVRDEGTTVTATLPLRTALTDAGAADDGAEARAH